MVPGDLLSAFPHRQFHTLPSLLDSWAALSNSYPNACVPMQGGSVYHFYDGLWYDPAERRTHDLPCERRTRYRLSQPDTVKHRAVYVETCMQLGKSTSYPLLYLNSRLLRYQYYLIFVLLTLLTQEKTCYRREPEV